MALFINAPRNFSLGNAAATASLNAGYAAQNQAFNNFGSVLKSAGDRIKGENSEDVAAEIASITDLDNFEQQKQAILARRKGTNYNENDALTAFNDRLTSLRGNVQYGRDTEQYNRDTEEYNNNLRRRPIIEQQTDDQSTTRILAARSANEKTNIEIGEIRRLQRVRDMFLSKGTQILDDSVVTDKDGNSSIDEGLAFSLFEQEGATPAQIEEYFANAPDTRLQRGRQASTAALDQRVAERQIDVAADSGLGANSKEGIAYNKWLEEIYLPTITANPIGPETAESEQKKMRLLLQRYEGKIPYPALKQFALNAVDSGGTPKTGYRSIWPFLGLNKLEGEAAEMSAAAAKANLTQPSISNNPYKGLF